MKSIFFLGYNFEVINNWADSSQYEVKYFSDFEVLRRNIKAENKLPHLVIVDASLPELDRDELYHLPKLLSDTKAKVSIPSLLIESKIDHNIRKKARLAGYSELVNINDLHKHFKKNIERLLDQKMPANDGLKKPDTYRMPLGKRLFDIAVSGGLLFLLSPLFLIIALIIKFTSKGPAFYYSYRVGTGYKIFKFYKFRSMRQDADQMVDQLSHLNHYSSDSVQVPDTPSKFDHNNNDLVLVGDEEVMGEDQYLQQKEDETKKAFFKVANDPRITPIGRLIRKTSIDELPQLFNVLVGDMSLVGNRPLPLYEAEKLTSDDWVKRFMSPAGITGLWQVTERGKAQTSDDSRKQLDIEYAKHYSFWTDLKILIKTPLAALQHENV